MGSVTATAHGPQAGKAADRVRTFRALVGAGFCRYATYRQATVAGSFTNSVFGFLRCYVLLAVAGGAGELIARLAGLAPLRDVAVQEPDIEDVVARLYGSGPVRDAP